MELAQKVERAILELAGFVESAGRVDALLGVMSDDDKRCAFFALLNPLAKKFG